MHEKAWKLWSEHIRGSSADWRGFGKCYTCGIVKNWKELQAGHYRHRKLDFDPRNIHSQCVSCNKWRHGNLDSYTLKLIEELGLDGVKQLRKDAEKHQGYTRLDLLEIIEKYGKKN